MFYFMMVCVNIVVLKKPDTLDIYLFRAIPLK